MTIIRKDYVFIAFCLFLQTANAVDTATLEVAKLAGKSWGLEGVSLEVGGLNRQKAYIGMSAKRLLWPKPFNDFTLTNIHCTDFTWHQDEVDCKQGKATVKASYWQSPTANFSFHLSPRKSIFQLKNAKLAGSRVALAVETSGNNWHCKINALHIDNRLVDKLLQAKKAPSKQAKSKQGYLNVAGTISGYRDTVQRIDLTTDVVDLSDQSQDGKAAAEKLNLLTHVVSKKTGDHQWHWQSESKMVGGALYSEPVYLEAGTQPIVLNTRGVWDSKTKRADIQSFTYSHPDAGVLGGSAVAYYRNGFKIEKANIALHSDTLQGLVTTYINPFFTESPFTGMKLTGDIQGEFTFLGETLTDISVRFSKLNVQDEAGRMQVKDGAGLINWSADALQKKQSELSWQKLVFKGLPFKPAKMKFTSQGRYFALDEKLTLPLFNGSVVIDKFSWQGKGQDEPDVSFAGLLDNISLEQVSKKLGWTPLSGNISGRIPGVDYHDKTLSLAGELLIQVFDGAIKINKLTASKLFSDLPQVAGDVEIDNLDLDQLTRKFEFGNITGRLSGNINKLVLENWHALTFFAWLGTPEDDESSHRISQKAVKNIASIGGGATDLVSRSFLRFFETFGYDKIGVGCYLHDGVCQMMGLEAAGAGYYLIKGGGLPRIDVLGYNPQINWDVLVERLSRIASPDNAIIQ